MALALKLHQLDRAAKEAGYEDYKSFLRELYEVQKLSLEGIAERLNITTHRVKKHLVRFSIPLRRRGGPNNVKVVITAELLHEVAKDGVPAVARRLGVQPSVLYNRLKGVTG